MSTLLVNCSISFNFQSVRAVSVHFALVRNYIMFGIALLDYICVLTARNHGLVHPSVQAFLALACQTETSVCPPVRPGLAVARGGTLAGRIVRCSPRLADQCRAE